ncbi:MAG: V-type ATPase subunit [Lachnospiraceae bacterium]
MKGLLAYSGLTAKVRAMSGKLLRREDFDTLIACPDMQSALAFLRQTQAYQAALAPLADGTAHREQIEAMIETSIFRDYAKIYNFAEPEQEKFLKKYARRYEIKVLKNCLRNAYVGQKPGPEVFRDPAFFTKFTLLDPAALSEAKSIPEVVEALKGTEYYEVLKKLEGLPNIELFDYETALDIFHFRKIWQDKGRIVSKDSVEILTRAYGTRVDMLNLWYIHRARSWYRMSAADTYRIILPVHYHLRKEEIAALIAAETEEQFANELSKTRYGRNYEELRPDNLEEMYGFILKKILRAEARKHPYSVATLFDYLYRKEHQDYRVITAIECIRYGIRGEEAKNMIEAL